MNADLRSRIFEAITGQPLLAEGERERRMLLLPTDVEGILRELAEIAAIFIAMDGDCRDVEQRGVSLGETIGEVASIYRDAGISIVEKDIGRA